MSENLRIWDKVSKTNPAHTKKVNQRGGFTAISAHYQVKAATEAFGPIGVGWGYTASEPIILGDFVSVGVTLWHGSRENTFGPVWGGADLKDSKGKTDSDAPKKAGTDGLTKGLSQLGFNADVFLGRFDDNKYVAQMEREFAEAAASLDQNAKINETQRVWLIGHAEKSIGVSELCKHYGKTTIKDFTVGELEPARDWLKSPTAKAA